MFLSIFNFLLSVHMIHSLDEIREKRDDNEKTYL